MVTAGRDPQDIPVVIAHAVTFFQLPDKELTVAMLQRGQALEPADRKWSAQLGYVYASAILGLTLVNQNGLPMAGRSIGGGEALAAKARRRSRIRPTPTSWDRLGYTLYQKGSMLFNSRKAERDPTILRSKTPPESTFLAPKEPNDVDPGAVCTA